jgi:hypothetical protein
LCALDIGNTQRLYEFLKATKPPRIRINRAGRAPVGLQGDEEIINSLV